MLIGVRVKVSIPAKRDWEVSVVWSVDRAGLYILAYIAEWETLSWNTDHLLTWFRQNGINGSSAANIHDTTSHWSKAWNSMHFSSLVEKITMRMCSNGPLANTQKTSTKVRANQHYWSLCNITVHKLHLLVWFSYLSPRFFIHMLFARLLEFGAIWCQIFCSAIQCLFSWKVL